MGLSISECLRQSVRLTSSDSARVDVELLLAHILNKDRTYLYTWPERQISAAQLQQFDQMLEERMKGTPIAYLLGQREFWGLSLLVNESTLIPRPDTELLVETALQLDLPSDAKVLDLGTGTGAIALALATEKPAWRLLACDKFPEAVKLAQSNVDSLGVHNVTVMESNWFSALPANPFHLIVSNPPYIHPADPHLKLGDVRFEPFSALVADNNGLADIDIIVDQARAFLWPQGWLILEHGYDQAEQVRERFRDCGYVNIQTFSDLGGNERISMGQVTAQVNSGVGL